jgi:hypothetical protein
MTPTRCSDWRDLPFDEIWNVDTEYYPGPGLANGGRHGDASTPLCLAAVEMRSGRVIQLWQDELGPFPPYRLDGNALFLCYLASAEFGFHQALGWGQPACAIDVYVEFRHITNDARVKSSGPTRRENGFYSLARALRYFGEDTLSVAHKINMRDRIMRGPPFTRQEHDDILRYNLDDALALRRLARHVLPRIPSLRHGLHRARVGWAITKQERRGVPTNRHEVDRLHDRWNDIKVDLVNTLDRQYQCYEIVNGIPHFRDERLLAYAAREGIDWPRLEADPRVPDKQAETFRSLSRVYPQVGNLHELRSTLAQLRNNKLAIGSDGRNRCLYGLFGTKTGRNAPRSSEFIFGPAKCLRFLIEPPPGMALVHRDYAQQEVRIAAVKAKDPVLLAACRSGDVYLGIAERLGFDPTKPGIRDLFKIVVLAINYGAGPHMLAGLAAISLYEAAEIVARLRARFRVFDEWCARSADYAGLKLHLTNELGWSVLCPPGSPVRTIRNWPVQACGAAIMHTVCLLAERRGIEIVAPVHDAFMAQCRAEDLEDVSRELDRCMRDASKLMLDGYEIPTGDEDGKWLIRPGQRFFDKRGAAMWGEINRLLDKVEVKTA